MYRITLLDNTYYADKFDDLKEEQSKIANLVKSGYPVTIVNSLEYLRKLNINVDIKDIKIVK